MKISSKFTKWFMSLLVVVCLLTSFAFTAFATDEEILSKQIGGSYGSIPSAYGGDRHHCFAGEVYSYVTVNKYNSSKTVIGSVTYNSAPCIVMTKEDHQKTASWGSSTAAKNYRNQQKTLVQQGKYLAAMQMDINDIRAKFGSRYDGAISKMWTYATGTCGWYQ